MRYGFVREFGTIGSNQDVLIHWLFSLSIGKIRAQNVQVLVSIISTILAEQSLTTVNQIS
jgi:hypothetical protein